MLHNKKIIVVLPAFNAALTLENTLREIPTDIVDEIILVDDGSKDNTVPTAKNLGIRNIIVHDRNMGYGANQKTCYTKAIERNADIVVMLHPDYQYTPKLITAMCSIIDTGIYPVVLGSRILGMGALKGGMPIYKYFFNRLLTFIQNILMWQKLSEYHTGYRAFSTAVLKDIRFMDNSNGFVFDNEILSQIFMKGFEIAEITCPTSYFKNASSINFKNSIVYGCGVLYVAMQYRLHKWKIIKARIY